MDIFYHISPYPTLAEDLIVKVYEASAPTVEVATVAVPAPHNLPRSISVNGLDRVVHIVKLIGVTSGTVFHNYDRLPTENIVTLFDPIIFKIGDGGANTPAATTHTYVNTDMAALTGTDYTIFRNGYGFLINGIHYDNRVGGGFVLKIAGDQFADQEEFLVQIKPKAVSNPVNDSVVGKLFGDFLDVNTPTDFDATHLRKLIRLAGANAIYSFQTDVPIGYIFRFTNFGPYASPADTPEVHFNNAPMLYGNTTLTVFPIPFKGTAEFVFDGINWNCTMANTSGLGALPFGYISHIGNINIGNVVYENGFTVTIPDQGSGNYTIVGSLREQSNNVQLAVSWTVRDKTGTNFKVYVGEWAEVTQDLKFEFAVLRTN